MITLIDRIEGMLIASAIADAMAGPFEGRSTATSQQYLNNGGWIDQLKSYTPAFQHHWNVYQRTAPAGTFTDDTRLRLLICQAMIENDKQHLMTKEFLADYIFSQYQIVYNEFEQRWQKDSTNKNVIQQSCKERFLHLWFLWEITKTATEVFIPQNPPLYSPPAVRVNENGDYSTNWRLEKQTTIQIDKNIKDSYHHNTYQKGEQMPLGLIALLPLGVYFPGDPAAAFHYILEIDFFDIKDADLYAAVATAILADLLGGTFWNQIVDKIENQGLDNYIDCKTRTGLQCLEKQINDALSISRLFRNRHDPYSRENYIRFIKALHNKFAVGEQMMCTVYEMLSVAIALMNYAPPDLKQIIEMGINYGRDNDTVASITACFAGALLGIAAIPTKWRQVIENINQVNFKLTAKSLAKLTFMSLNGES